MDEGTNTKLKGAVRNFANWPKIWSVPRSKLTQFRFKKTSQLMLYREINAVCSQIRTKHINTLSGQKVEFTLNVELTVQGIKRGVPNMEIWQFEKKKDCSSVPCTECHCLASRLVPV